MYRTKRQMIRARFEILFRGYFSKVNIKEMDKQGYSFVLMVKGMYELVSSLVSENKGTFENKWAKHIDEYDVYGTTVKQKMFETDSKERYFHIYHNIGKESGERAHLAKKLRQMKTYMMRHTNEVIDFGPGFSKYYILHYNEKNGVFQFPEDRTDVIERENNLSGYFCLITSEKLFCGDKSYLGDKSLRIYGDSATETKIFIEFIALIIRNRIYNYLKDEMKNLEKRPNFMTVPATLRELDKIEMVRLTDNKYRVEKRY